MLPTFGHRFLTRGKVQLDISFIAYGCSFKVHMLGAMFRIVTRKVASNG